ncbi:hypothetical protein Bbelb_078390 [Branchiostoma belcheri]|nr:hypothetical protein Bbelb_078390 [Branchiostoma belcheri]
MLPTVLAFVLASCGGLFTDVTLGYEHDVSFENQLNLQNRIILDPCASKDVLEGDIILDDWTKEVYKVEEQDGVTLVSRKSHHRRNEPARNNKHHRPRKSKLRPAVGHARSHRERRAATAVESRLWPGGVIPYVVDAGFSRPLASPVLWELSDFQALFVTVTSPIGGQAAGQYIVSTASTVQHSTRITPD